MDDLRIGVGELGRKGSFLLSDFFGLQNGLQTAYKTAYKVFIFCGLSMRIGTPESVFPHSYGLQQEFPASPKERGFCFQTP